MHGAVLAAIGLFSIWLMWSTFNTKPGYLVIDSKLFSDFGAHIPLIRSFSLGSNIPPEYPTFPGKPIRYHFLFYMAVGYIERIGVPLGMALNTLSALGFGLLLWMVYKIGFLYSKKVGVGILAVVLVLFNGSLTFIDFFKKHPPNTHTLTDIVTAQHFTNFAPWDGKDIAAFWNLNIYTNQRHLGMGFGLALMVLWPLMKVMAVKKRVSIPWWYWIIVGVACLILPWLHQAALVMVGVIFMVSLAGSLKKILPLLPYYMLCFLLAVPGMAYWRWAGVSTPEPMLGFIATDTSPLGLLWFWWRNLGFYLPLIPLLWLIMPKDRRVVFTGFITLFILANLYNFSTDRINNHKLINFFWIYTAIETALFLNKGLRRWWSLAPALVLLFFLTFSGIIDIFPIINDAHGNNPDVDNIPVAVWIRDTTPPQSVFLTTHYFYHPASIAGRKIYLDYGYFNWSMGYPDGERRHKLPYLFSSTLPLPSVCHLLEQEGLDYVMISPGRGDLGTLEPKNSTFVREGQPVYENEEGFLIYSVKETCRL